MTPVVIEEVVPLLPNTLIRFELNEYEPKLFIELLNCDLPDGDFLLEDAASGIDNEVDRNGRFKGKEPQS